MKIVVAKSDLEHSIGAKLSNLFEALTYAKCELESEEGGNLNLKVHDFNRPDLWSTEGVARAIKPFFTKEKGVPKYSIKPSLYEVKVDESVKQIRPRTACAVIKNIKITDDLLKQIIQLQEKVAASFGRKRKEAAIGVYDLDKIKWPVKYTTTTPEGIRFIPLDFDKPMTPSQILARHPKGQEFANLLEGKSKYPIFIDAANQVLSLPPIINSDYTGKVTEQTKNLFIEVTGFEDKFVEPALLVMAAVLIDRGGEAQEVTVNYGGLCRKTPNFDPKEIATNTTFLQKITGLKLSTENIKDLLEKARYDIKVNGNLLALEYPAYRQDIISEVDVAEDLLIAYGYNKIEPEELKLVTDGKLSDEEILSKKLRELLVGFGAQEIATSTLTNSENLFRKMNLETEPVAELENPVSSSWSTLRSWLLPSAMEFLSANTTKEFPQKIFEVGKVIILDAANETKTKDEDHLTFVISQQSATFTDVKQVLGAICSAFGKDVKIEDVEHKSFILGRAGKILINKKEAGIIGEFHPKVLASWGLSIPVAGFELDVSALS